MVWGPLPPSATLPMPSEIAEPPALRSGDCPFCERTVVVHEEPPRCPLCACPIDGSRMRPFRPGPDAYPDDAPADI
jgi:hypothetical protein